MIGTQSLPPTVDLSSAADGNDITKTEAVRPLGDSDSSDTRGGTEVYTDRPKRVFFLIS